MGAKGRNAQKKAKRRAHADSNRKTREAAAALVESGGKREPGRKQR